MPMANGQIDWNRYQTDPAYKAEADRMLAERRRAERMQDFTFSQAIKNALGQATGAADIAARNARGARTALAVETAGRNPGESAQITSGLSPDVQAGLQRTLAEQESYRRPAGRIDSRTDPRITGRGPRTPYDPSQYTSQAVAARTGDYRYPDGQGFFANPSGASGFLGPGARAAAPRFAAPSLRNAALRGEVPFLPGAESAPAPGTGEFTAYLRDVIGIRPEAFGKYQRGLQDQNQDKTYELRRGVARDTTREEQLARGIAIDEKRQQKLAAAKQALAQGTARGGAPDDWAEIVNTAAFMRRRGVNEEGVKAMVLARLNEAAEKRAAERESERDLLSHNRALELEALRSGNQLERETLGTAGSLLPSIASGELSTDDLANIGPISRALRGMLPTEGGNTPASQPFKLPPDTQSVEVLRGVIDDALADPLKSGKEDPADIRKALERRGVSADQALQYSAYLRDITDEGSELLGIKGFAFEPADWFRGIKSNLDSDFAEKIKERKRKANILRKAFGLEPYEWSNLGPAAP